MVVAETPFSDSSRLNVSHREISAAFVAPYADSSGSGCTPVIDAMATTFAAPAVSAVLRRVGNNDWSNTYAERTLTWYSLSNRRTGSSPIGPFCPIPALRTNASTLSNWSRWPVASVCNCSSSDMSAVTTSTRTPCSPERRPAKSCNGSRLRALIVRSQPAAANRVAIAAPIPREAPVTNATLRSAPCVTCVPL